MRRGAATVVALVGEVRADVPQAAARARNVALVGAKGDGLEAALRVMERAEGVVAPYALVAVDPLEGVARAWRGLWAVERERPDEFERVAHELVGAAHGRSPLPDYYLVLAPRRSGGERAEPHPNDFHLGVLSSVRPGRVVGLTAGDSVAQDAARVLAALPALPQGPWWPPLEDVVAAARRFYPETLVGARG